MKRRLPDWVAAGVIAVGLFVRSLAALSDYAEAGLLDQCSST
jgi:hypothetical protein